LFSYALVHSGYGHIAPNAIIQLLVGLPLEMSHGTVRLGAVYVAGVLAGSLATACFDPRMYLAGASGGLYALIAAHLATLILNWKEDAVLMRKRRRKHKISKAAPGTVIRLMRLLFVLFYAAADTGQAVTVRLHYGAASTTVGYTAHLAGAIAGLLVGLVSLKNRKREAWETVVRLVSLMAWLLLAGLAVWWNIQGDSIYAATQGEGEDTTAARSYFLTEDYSPLEECDFLGRNLGDY
jgi:rhomboid-related protein 1/2/3